MKPTDDGNVVRVVLPALTEERRKEYVKQAKSKAEDGRVSVRGVRRKAKDQLDRLKKDGEASEDDVERAEKQLDGLTKAHTEQIDKMLATKESELLNILWRRRIVHFLPESSPRDPLVTIIPRVGQRGRPGVIFRRRSRPQLS